jgi:hypothetical protein
MNKRSRTQCQYCRFAKCVAVGMKMTGEAVRTTWPRRRDGGRACRSRRCRVGRAQERRPLQEVAVFGVRRVGVGHSLWRGDVRGVQSTSDRPMFTRRATHRLGSFLGLLPSVDQGERARPLRLLRVEPVRRGLDGQNDVSFVSLPQVSADGHVDRRCVGWRAARAPSPSSSSNSFVVVRSRLASRIGRQSNLFKERSVERATLRCTSTRLVQHSPDPEQFVGHGLGQRLAPHRLHGQETQEQADESAAAAAAAATR